MAVEFKGTARLGHWTQSAGFNVYVQPIDKPGHVFFHVVEGRKRGKRRKYRRRSVDNRGQNSEDSNA